MSTNITTPEHGERYQITCVHNDDASLPKLSGRDTRSRDGLRAVVDPSIVCTDTSDASLSWTLILFPPSSITGSDSYVRGISMDGLLTHSVTDTDSGMAAVKAVIRDYADWTWRWAVTSTLPERDAEPTLPLEREPVDLGWQPFEVTLDDVPHGHRQSKTSGKALALPSIRLTGSSGIEYVPVIHPEGSEGGAWEMDGGALRNQAITMYGPLQSNPSNPGKHIADTRLKYAGRRCEWVRASSLPASYHSTALSVAPDGPDDRVIGDIVSRHEKSGFAPGLPFTMYPDLHPKGEDKVLCVYDDGVIEGEEGGTWARTDQDWIPTLDQYFPDTARYLVIDREVHDEIRAGWEGTLSTFYAGQAARLRAELEGAKKLNTRLAEEKQYTANTLERIRKEYGEDMERIGRALISEAEDRDWCDEYDEVIDALNEKLHAELPLREREFSFTVAVTYHVDVTATGTTLSEAYDSWCEDTSKHDEDVHHAVTTGFPEERELVD